MSNADDFLRQDIAFKGDFIVSPTGDLELNSGLDNIKDALLRRLITQPGTLIHRPNYGVGIQSYLNGTNTLDTQRQIAMRIKEQFEQDERVEAVTGVRVSFSDQNPEIVEIFVRVIVASHGEETMSFVPFGG